VDTWDKPHSLSIRSASNAYVGPGEPEKAEISVHEAEDLYREIRIDNALVTEDGEKVKLKEGVDVDVIVESDSSDLIKKPEN